MIAFARTLLLGALITSCAPMTFSHDAEVDFDTYPSVLVSVNAPIDSAAEYLARELRESSGFENVTTDATESASLVLTVDVSVTETSTIDEDGNTDIDYEGSAVFRAATPSGRTVLEGTENDTSETPSEAAEDVLDQVARRFLAPYRI